ncbi:HAMP domain-containing histidine kinase [Sphingobacterium sp. SRCM116780]|uniref:sensor histidine kinase n=1 Tax=Sphingobacterium sp. SRCM116780 TaxID=2907623 RepID=UPI001F3FBABC|nr:HAMP domain-containing sensor histidine kinase [Sphingobacterium sp. SRCM116780]UIR57682.1 HAMP domain-containing histidine kinase [Sphingobacterium sp. SRCM116780]
MARKKKIRILYFSSFRSNNYIQRLVREIIDSGTLQIEIAVQSSKDLDNLKSQSFGALLKNIDLVLSDLSGISSSDFFEIGIARAVGKPIVFISKDSDFEDLPLAIKQSYFLTYTRPEELKTQLLQFLIEFAEKPERFSPRNIIGHQIDAPVDVDIEKIGPRDFENLCFELLAQLGYKKLEWQFKEDFIDAITSIKKRDPDGFEYEEFWLIAFSGIIQNQKMLDIALHDPEFFLEHIHNNLYNEEINRRLRYNTYSPITLLIVLPEKNKYAQRLIKEFHEREFRHSRRGRYNSLRIRFWDQDTITKLVQNNSSLARKYFSSDSLTRSGVRLSYEELYNQNTIINEELTKKNAMLLAERQKIETLERDAAWKLLSFTAAHRLGNPMDAIDSELSNLRKALSVGRTDMLQDIIKSMEIPVERAKSIVSEFRNLSIAQEIKTERINYEKLREILVYCAKKAVDNGVKIDYDLAITPDIQVDVKKITDCFQEIVNNSLHFIKEENKSIEISTHLCAQTELPEDLDKTKSYIKISFSDHGCGIPLDRKKSIFIPFERSYIHGTGLGLAFCENAIEAHGGKIQEVGKPGEGAIFEIFLPLK